MLVKGKRGSTCREKNVGRKLKIGERREERRALQAKQEEKKERSSGKRKRRRNGRKGKKMRGEEKGNGQYWARSRHGGGWGNTVRARERNERGSKEKPPKMDPLCIFQIKAVI